MSVKVTRIMWKATGLSVATKMVALCLADHANQDSLIAYPCYETIMEECGVSRPTVARAIRELGKLGLFELQSGGKGPRDNNEYNFKELVENFPKTGRIPAFDVAQYQGQKADFPESPKVSPCYPYEAAKGIIDDELRVSLTTAKGIIDDIPSNEPLINRNLEARAARESTDNSRSDFRPESRPNFQPKSQPETRPEKRPAPTDRHAPFHEGQSDTRFGSPIFGAVAAACDVGIEATFKMRCRVAACAVALEDAGFSPAHVALARERWYLERSPTPEQLRDEIRRLVSQKAPGKSSHATTSTPTQGRNGAPESAHARAQREQRNIRERLAQRARTGK